MNDIYLDSRTRVVFLESFYYQVSLQRRVWYRCFGRIRYKWLSIAYTYSDEDLPSIISRLKQEAEEIRSEKIASRKRTELFRRQIETYKTKEKL